MGDFPYQHVLQAGVRDIGHGVRIAANNSIDSQTFGCFLRDDTLWFGYFYKNGGTMRVKTLNTARHPAVGGVPALTNAALRRGDFVIVFDQQVSGRGFTGPWTVADITPAWFHNASRDLCLTELRAIRDSHNEVDDIVNGLQDLTLAELRRVHEFMIDLR